MKQLTWSDFDQFQPCYSPQEKYGDFNGTILDILKDERIPSNDKIWAATCKGILPDYVNRKFATQCCRQIWHLLTDERSRNAVEVAERFNEGEATAEELNVAWVLRGCDAASVLRAAAWAAWAAAWVAAAWAARDAAGDAARDAARAADGAWAAARAAGDARAAQVKLLINIIEEYYNHEQATKERPVKGG